MGECEERIAAASGKPRPGRGGPAALCPLSPGGAAERSRLCAVGGCGVVSAVVRRPRGNAEKEWCGGEWVGEERLWGRKGEKRGKEKEEKKRRKGKEKERKKKKEKGKKKKRIKEKLKKKKNGRNEYEEKRERK